MPYLNLDIHYFDHIKTKRLVGLLGRGAAELPLRLWAHCGANIAKAGNLAGYSAQEIESIVGWWGREGEMVGAMIKVGFLEEIKDGFNVHDWEDHEGHLVSFHLRAKEAARERWAKARLLGDATSIASSNAKEPDKQCSSLTIPALPTKPTETPSACAPISKRFAKPTPEEVSAYAKEIGFKLDGNHFVDHYESKGWLVGRSAMKDWKAAVRTWRKNGFSNGGGAMSATVAPPLAPPPKYEEIPPEDRITVSDVRKLVAGIGRKIS